MRWRVKIPTFGLPLAVAVAGLAGCPGDDISPEESEQNPPPPCGTPPSPCPAQPDGR